MQQPFFNVNTINKLMHLYVLKYNTHSGHEVFWASNAGETVEEQLVRLQDCFPLLIYDV